MDLNTTIKAENLELDFLIDDEETPELDTHNNFKVIIADDDEEVHKLTKMILEDFKFDGMGLEFIDTYSGKETMELFDKYDDIALVFLDVVMENDHSGLEVVKHIRDVAKNNFVRIILRTGQPGKAPEEKIISEYDINDYKSKTELTVQKLYTTLYSGLRSYRDLRIIESNKRGLEQVIEATTGLFKYQSFDSFVGGILYQLSSLFDFEKDAFFARTVESKENEGFISLKHNDGNIIFAGIGKYKNHIGEKVELIVDEEVVSAMSKIEDNGVVFLEDKYIGHHRGVNNIDNYIYMEGTEGITDLDQSLLKIFMTNFSVAFDNYQLNKDIYDTQKEVVLTLGEVIEKKNAMTANHVRRVSEISSILAKAYGLSDKKAELIKVATPMHDIGKVAISDNILLKPGKLTDDEFEIMKTHAELGYNILKHSNREILKMAATVALEHHERWDGTGYPQGKKGEEIAISARITMVADVFDALTHDRCYKKAWSIDDTLSYFKEESGKMFEPKLVEILFENINKIVSVLEKYTD